jgi:parallel beta-helix repeat protein
MSMLRKSELLVAYALFFVLGAATAQATTYYVATTGNDSNPGTLEQPFRSILKGASVLKPGDTTMVRAGTYTESIPWSFNFPSGTSWSSAVTLAAYPGETVTMKGSIDIGGEPRSYIIIDRLIIDAINTAGDAVAINQGSHHVRFQNCEIKNSYVNGVWIGWGNINGLSSDYNEIINCTIHHIARNGGDGFPNQPSGYGRGHGIYITTSNNIIRGNTFYDIGEYSIHQWTASPKFANNNIIDGNVTTRSGHNTTRYGKVCCGGITVSAGNGTIIRNNIVYGNEVHGIEVNSSCSNCKVYNNTTYNNPAWNIRSSDAGSGIEIRNNIAYPKGIYSGSGSVSTNNLTTNPNFVNAAGNDFRLLSSSPAIDSGMSLSAVPVDFSRNSRPQGPAHDIGAYEFGATNAAPASPRNLSVR